MEDAGKETKSKIGRMKLKSLSGIQLDITSYLATSAGKAKGAWSGSHSKGEGQICLFLTTLPCSNPLNDHFLIAPYIQGMHCTALCSLRLQVHFMQGMHSQELMESKTNLDKELLVAS